MTQEQANETPSTQWDNSGYPRLEDLIAWYDKKSITAQRSFRFLKTVQIIVAAAIPVVSLIYPTTAIVPGALGALILILEGLQDLGMYRQNWQKYRSTCEGLRSEKYLFMALTGPYAGMDREEALPILAERSEAISAGEHKDWVAQVKSLGPNKSMVKA